jgi:hypothetical protein
MDYDPADHVPTSRQLVAGWLTCVAIGFCALALPAIWGKAAPDDAITATIARAKAPGLCARDPRPSTGLYCAASETSGVIVHEPPAARGVAGLQSGGAKNGAANREQLTRVSCASRCAGRIRFTCWLSWSCFSALPRSARCRRTSVSASAFVFDDDGLHVPVAENGILRKIIETRDLGTAVEVDDGVRAGEEVVLDPPVDLADGSKIAIGAAEPAPGRSVSRPRVARVAAKNSPDNACADLRWRRDRRLDRLFPQPPRG